MNPSRKKYENHEIKALGASMRIGVISDTHVKKINESPTTILEVLAGVDLIVHAGDFSKRDVLDELRHQSLVFSFY